MFFLSDVEYKLLINRLLPQARENPVDLQLRGWSWHTPPLKPDYDVKLPMFLVCSKYCPTSRDIYLYMVEERRGMVNENMILGAAIHATVRTAIRSFIKGGEIDFEDWYEATLREKRVRRRLEAVKKRSRAVWDFVITGCRSRLLEAMSRQPYASREDVLAMTIPFIVEHRVSGELLGLSGLLKIDCFDYMRNILFDIKVSQHEFEWYKLFPTGYALVLESVYEVPIDIGCTVYVWFKGERPIVKRDLYYIDDDLRSWWIEERDEKARLIALKMDPGLPRKCYEDCMYMGVCRP
jgi:CRISPR-associated protein Csa1